MTQIIVIGGGPAGMMAALSAAEAGADVTLLERNDRLGKKLRITGKGRCNVCNDCEPEAVIRAVPGNGKFLYGALMRFTPRDVMDFFEQHGVPLKTERGRRVFPCSDKAQDIVDALAGAVQTAGVQVRLNARVKALQTEGTRVTGVTLYDGTFLPAEAVIVAVGGASYPGTGSTGDGNRLLCALGVKTRPLMPSLVPLIVKGPDCPAMMGLSLRNCTLTVTDETRKGKKVFQELGELLFTHFGLSGPLVLSASAHMRSMEPDRYVCHIDTKPGLTAEKLDLRLQRDLKENHQKSLHNSLVSLLPHSMIPVVLRRSELAPEKRCCDVTREERLELGRTVKDLSFPVEGFRPLEEAIVTAGGIDVREMDPRRMQVKKWDNLFAAGEMLDVDAYTGGYNLQIAFSTGRLAGESAAEIGENR